MFSLTHGGPFYHVMRRCHFVAPDGRIRAAPLVAITWIPLAAATIVEVFVAGRADSAARDPVMHVRLLVSVPLLLVAEAILELRTADVVAELRRDSVVERATLDAILARAEQLRDAWGVEVGLAIAVLAFGQIALWVIHGWSGMVSSFGVRVGITFGTLWCVSFALPLVQFLILRWLWRWGVWTYAIMRLARAPLSLNTLHPDRAGGIRTVSAPVDAFAIYLTANMFIFSAAWTVQLHLRQTTVPAVMPTFLALVIIAFIIALGPLMRFAGPLYRARYRDTVAYNGIVRRYVDEFRRKWILEPTGESLLGSQDIQSLNDLGGSFRTSDDTGVYPFGPRAILQLALGAVVPMLPILLAAAPVNEIAERLGKMVLGV